MNISTQPLEEMIQKLSPQLRDEVQTFIASRLTQSEQPNQKQKLRQDWAGMLRTNHYTSVGLQHLATEWRND